MTGSGLCACARAQAHVWVCGLSSLMGVEIDHGWLLWKCLELKMKEDLSLAGFPGMVKRVAQRLQLEGEEGELARARDEGRRSIVFEPGAIPLPAGEMAPPPPPLLRPEPQQPQPPQIAQPPQPPQQQVQPPLPQPLQPLQPPQPPQPPLPPQQQLPPSARESQSGDESYSYSCSDISSRASSRR